MARDVTIILKAVDQYSAPLKDFTQKIGTIGGDTKIAADNTNKAATAFDNLGKNVSTFIGAYAGMKGIQFLGDTLEIGQQANTTEGIFRSLTSPMENYVEILERIQNATGKIVDDKSLQAGANKLLGMNIATTPEELEKMLELAVKLGNIGGNGDASKSISDFALMLSNMSVLRLDNFSISSAAVRERIKELQDSVVGMSREEAFRLSVLEEGQKTLDRLGESADGASTPINRLMTDLTNKGQDMAQGFALSLNSLLGIVELAAGKNPIQLANKEAAAQEAQDFVSTYAQVFQQEAAAQGLDLMALFGSQENIDKALTGTFQDFQERGEESIDYLSENLNGMAAQLSGMTDDRLPAAMKEVLQNYVVDRNLAAIMATDEQNQRINQTMLEQQDIMAGVNAEQEAYERNLAAIQVLSAQDLTQRQASTNALDDFYNAYVSIGQVNPFMTRGDADALTQEIVTAEQAFERMKELNEQGLIRDSDLEQAGEMVDYLGEMKTEADKAAEAFENLSLKDVFGQGGGGMQGEISDMVLQQMKDNGATPEQIAAMQRQLDLTSGRETESSLMMQEQIVPQMAGLSPEDVAAQLQNYNALFQQSALQGLSQEQIMSMMSGLANMQDKGIDMTGGMSNFMVMMSGGYMNEQGSGMGGAGSIFDDEKGRKPGSKSLADTTAEMSADMTSINKDSTTVSKMFDNIQDATTTASKYIGVIKTAMEAIEGTKEVKFRITADDPNNILSTIQQVMGGGSIEEIVRNNGGSVPGQTNNHAGQGGV